MGGYDIRVCPKCGFHDLPIWRNSRFYFNVDVARISDIEYWDSRLASKIKINNFFQDEVFSYLLRPDGMVLRKETELLNKDTQGHDMVSKKEKWFQVSIEKHRKKLDSSQKKLFETKIEGMEGKKQ